MTQVTCILAISNNNVIGHKGKIPWSIPHDLQFFKMNTYGGTLIMGRKTWQSIGILPGRIKIVISRSIHKNTKSTYWVQSIEQAYSLAEVLNRPIYLIGGSIVNQCHVDRWILTRVQTDVEGDAIVHIPDTTLNWSSNIYKHKNISYWFEIRT